MLKRLPKLNVSNGNLDNNISQSLLLECIVFGYLWTVFQPLFGNSLLTDEDNYANTQVTAEYNVKIYLSSLVAACPQKVTSKD